MLSIDISFISYDEPLRAILDFRVKSRTSPINLVSEHIEVNRILKMLCPLNTLIVDVNPCFLYLLVVIDLLVLVRELVLPVMVLDRVRVLHSFLILAQ